MRTTMGLLLVGGILFAAAFATAQGPGGGPPRSAEPDDLVLKMMEFDANKDGKLTKAEVTDARLLRLFDRADADKDGVVTKDELTALAAKEQPSGGGPGGFGGPGGPGGFGPPGGGPGGRGPGGPMGRPRPGDVLAPMFRQQLNITADQKAQLDVLQTDVDAKLAKILTDDQKAQLKTMRDRGPGGPPGGPRGGGPPPPPPGDR